MPMCNDLRLCVCIACLRRSLNVRLLLLLLYRYSRLSDIVDHFFPPLPPNTPTQIPGGGKYTEYNSFMFWREELPDHNDEITAFLKKSEVEKLNEKKKPLVKKKIDAKPVVVAVKKTTVKK